MPTTRLSQGGFTGAELLKTKQKGKARALWVNIRGLDFAIRKGKPLDMGKGIEFSFLTDPGGGAMGGLDLINPRFVEGDFEKSTKNKVEPKHQTFTIEWQRVQDRYHAGEDKSFDRPRDMQFRYKVQAFKSLMNIQEVTDGTGRIATLNTIEGGASGATIIKSGTADTNPEINSYPLTFGIANNAVNGAGSVCHCYEGLVLSIVAACYDDNNDGAAELTVATCIPRLVMVGVREENTANNYAFWDAFRVARVDHRLGEIKVFPGRPGVLNGARQTLESNSDFDSITWCTHSGNVANGIEIAPAWGVSPEGSLSHAAVVNAGWDGVFNPAGAGAYNDPTLSARVYLFHPGYLPKFHDEARKCLGLNWNSQTDIGTLNMYWLTGVRALLDNTTNTVHGINRRKVLSYLPTRIDCGGNPLSLERFNDLLVDHMTRNLKTKVEFYILPVHPLVYSRILSWVQADVRYKVTDKYILGDNQKGEGIVIHFDKNKIAFTSSPEMPMDYIPCIPKNLFTLHGGEIETVKVGSQDKFLKLNTSSTGITERLYVEQEYRIVAGEITCEIPRAAAFMDNFTLA